MRLNVCEGPFELNTESNQSAEDKKPDQRSLTGPD